MECITTFRAGSGSWTAYAHRAFFRALAEDQAENAIGIILSGTATDGTMGLRAILVAGGICMVQEPADAKYDGLPQSAIRAGYATHILSTLSPEDQARISNAIQISVEGQTPYNIEYQITRSDGATRKAQSRAMPIVGEDDCFGLLCTFLDYVKFENGFCCELGSKRYCRV